MQISLFIMVVVFCFSVIAWGSCNNCLWQSFLKQNIYILEYPNMIMEKELYEKHAEICKTLSNPVRLEIINLLRDKEKSVTELVRITKISQSNVSQHLTILRQNNLVLTKRKGKNIYYRLAYPEMIKACDIMGNILFKQLERNENLVEKIRRAK